MQLFKVPLTLHGWKNANHRVAHPKDSRKCHLCASSPSPVGGDITVAELSRPDEATVRELGRQRAAMPAITSSTIDRPMSLADLREGHRSP